MQGVSARAGKKRMMIGLWYLEHSDVFGARDGGIGGKRGPRIRPKKTRLAATRGSKICCFPGRVNLLGCHAG